MKERACLYFFLWQRGSGGWQLELWWKGRRDSGTWTCFPHRKILCVKFRRASFRRSLLDGLWGADPEHQDLSPPDLGVSCSTPWCLSLPPWPVELVGQNLPQTTLGNEEPHHGAESLCTWVVLLWPHHCWYWVWMKAFSCHGLIFQHDHPSYLTFPGENNLDEMRTEGKKE